MGNNIFMLLTFSAFKSSTVELMKKQLDRPGGVEMVASLQVGAASPPFGLCERTDSVISTEEGQVPLLWSPLLGLLMPSPAGRGVLLSW